MRVAYKNEPRSPSEEVPVSTPVTATRTRLDALRAAAVAMLGLLAACVVLRLDRANLWIPFAYSNDALLQGAWAKALLEQPWIHRNPALAAPFEQQ
jgi:hypothetical protein